MVTILGSAWFPAVPASAAVQLLRQAKDAGLSLPEGTRIDCPIIGVVLVRVDPPGELKAYMGIAAGRNQAADEDFIAEWGAHFPVDAAQRLVNAFVRGRAKGEGGEQVPELELSEDSTRRVGFAHATGIYVRAKDRDGHWCNADIGQLERASLLAWLRSGRGNNRLAEQTVLLMLEHEPLASEDRSILGVGYGAGIVHAGLKKDAELEAMFEETRNELAKIKQLQDAYRAALLGRDLALPMVGIAERKAH